MFPLNKEVDYVSNGNYWTYYHKMWSEDTFLSYWNVKGKFKEAIEMVGKKRSDRRSSNILPLEELIMDYSCLGRESSQTMNVKTTNYSIFIVPFATNP